RGSPIPFPRNSATTASQVSATSRIPWEVWRSVIEAARRRQRSASASSHSIVPSEGIGSSGTLPLQQAAAILASSIPDAASLLTSGPAADEISTPLVDCTGRNGREFASLKCRRAVDDLAERRHGGRHS